MNGGNIGVLVGAEIGANVVAQVQEIVVRSTLMSHLQSSNACILVKSGKVCVILQRPISSHTCELYLAP